MGVVPIGSNDSRPSHMTVVRKRKLVVGSGRRNSDSSRAVAKPYGSSTADNSNSAPAGIGSPTRMFPLLSTMLYALRRAARVETSALGEFAPSFNRKIGSRPLVLLKRSCTSAGEIVHPVFATWQETHDRPFVPRLWKNGLFVSMDLPSSVIVRRMPPEFGVSSTALEFCARATDVVTTPTTTTTIITRAKSDPTGRRRAAPRSTQNPCMTCPPSAKK